MPSLSMSALRLVALPLLALVAEPLQGTAERLGRLSDRLPRRARIEQ